MMMTIGQREAGTQLTPVGQAPKVAVDTVRGHERPGFDCDDVKHGEEENAKERHECDS